MASVATYIALYTGPVIQNCEHTELDALRLYKLFLCIPFAGMGVYWYGCGYIPDCMGNLCSNGQVGSRQQRIQR